MNALVQAAQFALLSKQDTSQTPSASRHPATFWMSESLTGQRNVCPSPNTLHGRAIRRPSRDISAQKWSTRQTELFLVPALWRAHRRFVFQDRVANVAHTAEQTARVCISRSRQPLTVQCFPITKHLTQPPDSTCEQRVISAQKLPIKWNTHHTHRKLMCGSGSSAPSTDTNFVLQDRVVNVAPTAEQTARVYISRSRQTLPRARHP